MSTADLLSRLQGVRPRGSGRWAALCPAHQDRFPSLSIREVEDRILVHDFAGCSPREIVRAIGLELRDLFADAPLPRGSRLIPRPPRRRDRRRIALNFELHAIVLQERAEKTFQAASGLDCTSWSGDDFDRAMDAVGRAFDDLRHAETLFAVADSQREKAYWEGR